MLQETEILALKRDFRKKCRNMWIKTRKITCFGEQMQVIRERAGRINTETDAQEYEKKLQELQASGEVKARIHKEIERFQGISGNSSGEYGKPWLYRNLTGTSVGCSIGG